MKSNTVGRERSGAMAGSDDAFRCDLRGGVWSPHAGDSKCATRLDLDVGACRFLGSVRVGGGLVIRDVGWRFVRKA